MPTAQKIMPFLTFAGQAEEAMNFYTSAFDQGEILTIQRYGKSEAGEPGKVKHATFS